MIYSIPQTKFVFNGGIYKNKLFDPFSQSNNLNENQLKWLREAEFTNGRVSFISNFLLFIVPTEDFIPTVSLYFIYLLVFEKYRFYKNFTNFNLKPDIQPGKIIYYLPYSLPFSNLELFIIRISMLISLLEFTLN